MASQRSAYSALILRSIAKRCVSKDGAAHGSRRAFGAPHHEADLALQPLTAQIVLAREITPPISDPHVLVPRAKSVRLVRLAHKTACTGIFRTLRLKCIEGDLLPRTTTSWHML